MAKIAAAAGILLVMTAVPGTAQEQAAPSPSSGLVAVIQAPEAENVIRAGTEITFAMREELTTKGKKLRVGQRFQMETVGDVTRNGVVVIPSGTPAIGEITEVRNKGMWGKSGYIGARVVSLNLNGRTIRASGAFDDKGVTGTGGVVAAVALLPIAGFFTTGTSAVIPLGGQTKGFLDEDIHFQTVPAQAATVSAPVTASVVVPVVEPVQVPVQTAPAESQAGSRSQMPSGLTCTTCKQ